MRGPDLDDGLRALLERHRERAIDVVLVAASTYDGGPLADTAEGRGLLALAPERLVSVAVYVVAGAVQAQPLPERFVTEDLYRVAASDLFASTVLESLRRRRLPYSAQDARLLLELACSPFEVGAFDFAVAAAGAVLRHDPADLLVVEGLTRAERVLREQPVHRYLIPELRQKVRAMIAAHAPAGLLDLSAVEVTDHWGPVVRAAAERIAEDWDGAQPLLARLAAATQARPTARWQREVRELVAGSPPAAELLRTMLETLVAADLAPVPPDEMDSGGSTWLVSRANAVVVRGAALASRYVDAAWVTPLLGQVVLRGAASHPQRFVTVALCAKAAAGAVDALEARSRAGEAAAREQLEQLFGELTRRELLKRVAAALGTPEDELRRRAREVGRAKDQVQAAQASRAPRRAQSALGRVTRTQVRPALLAAGFTAGPGQSFWRRGATSVVGVRLGVADTAAVVTLAVWFATDLTAPQLEVLPAAEMPPVARFDVLARLVGPERGHWPVRLDEPGLEGRMASVVHALTEVGLPWLARWDHPRTAAEMLAARDYAAHPGIEVATFGSPDLAERVARRAGG